MDNIKKVMFISNGHGEDLMTSKLIQALLAELNLDLNISVLPIVGKGNRFESLPVNILGPRKTLPSGGFARNSWQNLFKDIKSGLLVNTFKQIRELRKQKKKTDLSVVVGDVYILLLTGLFLGGDIIFIPTAKSEYIDGHYKIEKYLMKKYANLVLPRDQKTTDDLVSNGINAEFNGNLMMDCFEINDIDFDVDPESIKIGILPGSREEAYDNMLDFIKVIEELEKLKKGRYDFLVAVADNFSIDQLKNKVQKVNWKFKEKDGKNVKLQILSPSGMSKINIIYNGFGDVLKQAELFMGMAGTANEQAVGLGKPVVTFPGTGAQFDYEFAANQKRLLGDGVKFVDRNFVNIAYSIIELLEDKEEYKKRSEIGKKRMGERGAVIKTVDKINDLL
ncbi:MAG: lipid-A-disaccharide synthase-related protein [Halanaerobiales bacterium]